MGTATFKLSSLISNVAMYSLQYVYDTIHVCTILKAKKLNYV